ncbi:hypothetical protein QBC35DRAFT_491821 [Podospora australis]|uniref:Uncharacterized protein n=1 Tax=Podospora australis TaxID=1536484 RepID=A0AAN7ALH2_9PEZI|nr:hypothetical protein QBC35DRAFT_491821 [Podospora australis]
MRGPSDEDLERWVWEEKEPTAIRLFHTFQATKDKKHLDAAIQEAQSAVECPPSKGTKIKPSLLNLLGILLLTRYQLRQQQIGDGSGDEDAKRALGFIQRALEEFLLFEPANTTGGDRKADVKGEAPAKKTDSQDENDAKNKELRGYVTNYCAALQMTYNHAGQDEDLEAGIAFLKSLKPYVGNPWSLDTLIMELYALGWEKSRNKQFLGLAISTAESVRHEVSVFRSRPAEVKPEEETKADALVEKHTDEEKEKEALDIEMEVLNHLGGLYIARFDAVSTDTNSAGQEEAIEKAIATCQEFANLSLAQELVSREDKGKALHNLSLALLKRSQLAKTRNPNTAMADLERAYDLLQQALVWFPKDDNYRLRLYQGLKILLGEFHHHGKGLPPLTHLGALDTPRSVKGLLPEGASKDERATWIFGVAGLFEEQFICLLPKELGEGKEEEDIPPDDLERAIVGTMLAMDATNPAHPDWGKMETTLRRRYRMWSEHTGKCPEGEVTHLGFSDGGQWIPTEVMAEMGMGDSLKATVAFVYGGDDVVDGVEGVEDVEISG